MSEDKSKKSGIGSALLETAILGTTVYLQAKKNAEEQKAKQKSWVKDILVSIISSVLAGVIIWYFGFNK